MSGKFSGFLWMLLPAGMAISGLAWNAQHQQRSDYHFTNNESDTIPSKSKPYSGEKNGDIDDQIQQLDKALKQLDRKIEKKDWEKMQRDLQESLSEIDTEKITAELEESLKNIDIDKIRKEIDRSMKNVDLKKIKRELQLELEKSRKNINREDINREIEKALREARRGIEEAQAINYHQLKEEISKARQNISAEKLRIAEEIAKAREEIDLDKINIQEELNKAKAEIKKTKITMENYRKMIIEMDKDGLLKSKENYSIQYKDGSLFINGKQQPKQVLDKYKPYFPMDGVTLKRELDGQFEIKN